MKVRVSELDGKTIVVEVEAGDEGQIVDMLDIKQNGFAMFGEAVEVPMAIVDGRLLSEDWFTRDHLLAIEAHELGHIRLETCEEAKAETEGIRLLEKNHYLAAAQILMDRGIV